MKILIGTNNQNKIKEIKEIVTNFQFKTEIEFLTLKDVGIDEDPEEIGLTMEYNAKLKARCYAKLSGFPVIAEDSGLCIHPLHDMPGVFSKRFYEACGNEAVLKSMEGEEDRSAYYKAVYCFYKKEDDKEMEIVVDGIMEGSILHDEKGTNGFAYDKIFYSNDLQKRLSEASDEEKNKYSHRKVGLHTLFHELKERQIID